METFRFNQGRDDGGILNAAIHPHQSTLSGHEICRLVQEVVYMSNLKCSVGLNRKKKKNTGRVQKNATVSQRDDY